MTEHSLSATLKAGTNYDAPWVVVYANTPDELKQRLDGITSLGVLEATVDAAATLRAIHNAQEGGLTPPSRLPTTTGAPNPGGTPFTQQPQPAYPTPQPPQSGGGWGQQAPQQQAPQAQQGGYQGGNRGVLHPENKACTTCGSVLEFKTTGGGKKKWQCPQWRWNNGNPNGHDVEWINS